jgi:hypothetical protein
MPGMGARFRGTRRLRLTWRSFGLAEAEPFSLEEEF